MTREQAYEAAVKLYADALKHGAAALHGTGTGGWKVSPTTASAYHRNVLEVAEFLMTAAPVPPGPCGAVSPVVLPAAERLMCELRAGHAGMHESEQGAWTATTHEGDRHE